MNLTSGRINRNSVRYQIGDRLFYKSNVARVEVRIKRDTYRVYERQEVLKCQ